MYSLVESKDLSHSGPHPFEEAPFSVVKNNQRQFEYLEMNLFRASNFPMRVYICFLVIGGFICSMDLTCPGAILIPLWLTRNPRKFPNPT